MTAWRPIVRSDTTATYTSGVRVHCAAVHVQVCRRVKVDATSKTSGAVDCVADDAAVNDCQHTSYVVFLGLLLSPAWCLVTFGVITIEIRAAPQQELLEEDIDQ